MNERTKLGAAVVGGYILGRTKQGGRALRTFMWLTGSTGGPEAVNFARSNVTKVLATEEAKAITDQVKGPLVEAVQKAAMQAVLARVTGLSQNLAERTTKLTSQVNDIAGETTDTVSDTAGQVTGLLGGKGDQDEEAEADNDEEQQEEKPKRRGRGRKEPQPQIADEHDEDSAEDADEDEDEDEERSDA